MTVANLYCSERTPVLQRASAEFSDSYTTARFLYESKRDLIESTKHSNLEGCEKIIDLLEKGLIRPHVFSGSPQPSTKKEEVGLVDSENENQLQSCSDVFCSIDSEPSPYNERKLTFEAPVMVIEPPIDDSFLKGKISPYSSQDSLKDRCTLVDSQDFNESKLKACSEVLVSINSEPSPKGQPPCGDYIVIVKPPITDDCFSKKKGFFSKGKGWSHCFS